MLLAYASFSLYTFPIRVFLLSPSKHYALFTRPFSRHTVPHAPGHSHEHPNPPIYRRRLLILSLPASFSSTTPPLWLPVLPLPITHPTPPSSTPNNFPSLPTPRAPSPSTQSPKPSLLPPPHPTQSPRPSRTRSHHTQSISPKSPSPFIPASPPRLAQRAALPTVSHFHSVQRWLPHAPSPPLPRTAPFSTRPLPHAPTPHPPRTAPFPLYVVHTPPSPRSPIPFGTAPSPTPPPPCPCPPSQGGRPGPAPALTVQRHELPHGGGSAAAVLHELHLGDDDVVLQHRAAARAHRVPARRVHLDLRAAASGAHPSARHLAHRPGAGPGRRPRPVRRRRRRLLPAATAAARPGLGTGLARRDRQGEERGGGRPRPLSRDFACRSPPLPPSLSAVGRVPFAIPGETTANRACGPGGRY